MTRDGAKMYGEHLGRGSRVGVKVQRCEGRETLSSGSGTRGSDSAHPSFFGGCVSTVPSGGLVKVWRVAGV
ncbi:MAG: hypothetical protein ACTSSA_10760 [Candidatus Freyarchaeota archaeon]